jgi:hypothetical protein
VNSARWIGHLAHSRLAGGRYARLEHRLDAARYPDIRR